MIGLSLLLVVLPVHTARASTDVQQYTVWSTTAAELLPSELGDTIARGRQRLGLDMRVEDAWRVTADGDLRVNSNLPDMATGDLFQLSLQRSSSWGRLSAGRLNRLDGRGFLPLDGVAADLAGTGGMAPSVWVGRLWSPETWQTGNTFVLGSELHLRPRTADGRLSRSVAASVGAEGRLEDGDPAVRAWGAGRLRSVNGASLGLDAEGQVGGQGGLRAGLRGALPVAKGSLGVSGRWEDLRPAGVPGALRTPLDLLGADGYAVAALDLRQSAGETGLSGSGGPVVHPGDTTLIGGLGRGALSHRFSTVELSVFGSGAGLAEGWVAGGGLGAEAERDRLSLSAEAGAFRYRPLDGSVNTSVEARLRGTAQLQPGPGLALACELATGSNRLLSPWVRGGLALTGHLSGRQESP